MRIAFHPRILAAVLATALLAAACAGAGGGPDGATDDAASAAGTSSSDDDLAVAIASFDLAVGDDQRLLTGLFTQDRELLAFGDATFQLGHLGEQSAGEAELTQEVTASFLPVPGMEPEGASQAPRLLVGETGSGVYSATVDLDEPGYWGVRVLVETEDGRSLQGSATFQVQESPQVLTVGNPAPASTNHTAADADAGLVEPAAVDSRAAGTDATIPDEHLHDEVIADVLDEGRPLVVAVTTPVYCVSRFCGPLTDVIADLARDYEDTAAFVHLEVWEDFDETLVNDAAGEWILGSEGGGGNEPWVFLVDGDGTVTHRWDNVLAVDELRAALDAL